MVSVGEIILSPGRAKARCRDPDDQMFLDCALAGKADFLVTGDGYSSHEACGPGADSQDDRTGQDDQVRTLRRENRAWRVSARTVEDTIHEGYTGGKPPDFKESVRRAL